MNLTGKIALVTGGGNGIGRAACLAFAQAGAKVVVVDVSQPAAEATAADVRALGSAALAVPADVSQSADVRAYVAAALEVYGRIDAFFNNAGIEGRVTPLAEFDEAEFDRVLAVNVRGTFLGLRHVLPVMLAQQSGSIINAASVAGTVGAPGLGAYCASKHAILGLTRTAAGEVGRQGVRVNAVCPGPIETRMMQSLAEQLNPAEPLAVVRANTARNPLGRYGTPDEVARVVVFLASDEAAYVNGAAWLIDGGRTAI